MAENRVTTKTFLEMKAAGRRIVMVTAYDFPTAHYLDEAGVDSLLVGDSLGMAVHGESSTLGVTLDDMVRAAKAVTRAVRRSLVVADLPFLTYQISAEQAIASAGRLLAEGGVSAVKLEGGRPVLATVRRLVEVGIPVLGHLGLTPQSVHALGGYRVQGRDEATASRLREEALGLQDAGAFGVVLEAVPSDLAGRISAELAIPTIGIGAGPGCDGQVLVFHDLVGLNPGRRPRFARTYASLGEEIRRAAARFAADVREGRFPSEEESYR